MKVHLIVEGKSDKILLCEQEAWFNALEIEVKIIDAGGKEKMIKEAEKHYKVSILDNADFVIFMPDQHSDLCALVTKQKMRMDSRDKTITIVLKRALEAWILADGRSIQDSIGLLYNPAGQTDTEEDPKRTLHSLLKRKLGHDPLTIEAINLVKPYFSIERAANNNKSACRFKDFIIGLSDG